MSFFKAGIFDFVILKCYWRICELFQVIHPVATQNDAYINLYDGRDGSLNARNNQLAASPDASMNPIGPAASNDSREEEQNRVKLMNEKNRQSEDCIRWKFIIFIDCYYHYNF